VSGETLLYSVSDVGIVAVPLKLVAYFTNPKQDGALPPVTATDKDILQLKNKDRMEGIISSIDDTRLQIIAAGNETPVDVPLANIAKVYFGGAVPPKVVPPLSVRLSLASGSVLTVPLDGAAGQAFSWTLNKIAFKDPGGKEQSISVDQLVSADVLGGRVVYLTELDPVSEAETTYLGTAWPMQINKNVLGQPLRVARNTYSRGIGVHTKSMLVYELDGSFDTLSLRVGLDDSSAPYGEAAASIVLDGKVLWQSKTLKPGEISAELSLPVKDGKRLELHADPTTRLDVLGRVNWLNVALRRK
jgi:hypothetical protein